MAEQPQSSYAKIALDLLQDAAQPGQMLLRVVSDSMKPWFQAGDLLRIERCPILNLRCGDMILWRNEQGLMTHRVVALEPQQMITKGDAVSIFDAPVKNTDVLGRVIGLEQAGGTLLWTDSLWQATARWQARLSLLEGRLQMMAGRTAGPLRPWLSRCVRLWIWPYRRLTRLWVQWLKRRSG